MRSDDVYVERVAVRRIYDVSRCVCRAHSHIGIPVRDSIAKLNEKVAYTLELPFQTTLAKRGYIAYQENQDSPEPNIELFSLKNAQNGLP